MSGTTSSEPVGESRDCRQWTGLARADLNNGAKKEGGRLAIDARRKASAVIIRNSPWMGKDYVELGRGGFKRQGRGGQTR